MPSFYSVMTEEQKKSVLEANKRWREKHRDTWKSIDKKNQDKRNKWRSVSKEQLRMLRNFYD